MKKSINHIALFIVFLALAIAGCKKDQAPELPNPTVSDIEIGLGNNEIGTIDADFHFNASIVAGDKIDKVEVKILQRAGEQYSKEWKHEIVWEQYKGAKNTTVHKHFNIPADAAEGKYDFLIIVHDENGTRFEEKRTITIYLKENLPVTPEISNMTLSVNGKAVGQDVVPECKKGDQFQMISLVRGVKGDGIMYLLLINKKHNHHPETAKAIDFSKAIVLQVAEHKNKEIVGTHSAIGAKIVIGETDVDANQPQGNPISGAKVWESGTYYVAVVYTNTTYNMGVYRYKEIEITL